MQPTTDRKHPKPKLPLGDSGSPRAAELIHSGALVHHGELLEVLDAANAHAAQLRLRAKRAFGLEEQLRLQNAADRIDRAAANLRDDAYKEKGV